MTTFLDLKSSDLINPDAQAFSYKESKGSYTTLFTAGVQCELEPLRPLNQSLMLYRLSWPGTRLTELSKYAWCLSWTQI